jgi:parvulin-like peptidyl-prolyl isomerase
MPIKLVYIDPSNAAPPNEIISPMRTKNEYHLLSVEEFIPAELNTPKTARNYP